MFEYIFGVALGLLIASNVALWIKLDNCYSGLTALLKEKSTVIENIVFVTTCCVELATKN